MSYSRWSGSIWYIYWQSYDFASFGKEQNEKRKDQYLATWLAGKDHHPSNDYNTIKRMYETDDWSELGYDELPEKETLVACVKEWLDEVEAEFPY